MKKTLLSSLIFLALPIYAANYDEQGDSDFYSDFYGDANFVEIATGIKTQIHKAPAVASVFTAQDIKNMGALDIDEVLESVPGLHVSRNANSYLPMYSFRGVLSTYNPQVLMLINGVPITNVFVGNRNQVWGGMPIESIAKIEVIRGSGSAVYGADAFAGVINITTKNADEIKETELGLRAGHNATYDLWLNHADTFDQFKYALSIEYHKTDGANLPVEADAQTLNDSFFATHASLAPGALSLGTENLDVRAQLEYVDFTIRAGLQQRDDVGAGAGIAESLDPNAKQFSQRWNLDLNYHKQLNDELELDVQAALFSTSQEIKNQYLIFPEGADVGFGAPFPDGMIGNPEIWERHYRLNSTLLYSGFDKHLFRLGVGYHLADLYKVRETKNFALGPDGNFLAPGSALVDVSDTPYVFLNENDRENWYLFIQDIWSLANDWELTAGIRYDDYTDFGSTTNPRLALVWSTSLNLTTKLLYSQAFRAPSFSELGNINNPIALGNPNLTPEEIETLELSFDYRFKEGLNARWNFYQYNWDDIIQYVPDENTSSSTSQNFGKQTGVGTEIELSWQVNQDLKLASNFAWSKAENDLTDQDVAFVPSKQWFVQLDWQVVDALHFNIKSNLVLDRKRDQADPRDTIDDYKIVDMSLRWQDNNYPLALAFIAKNIFSEDAREPSVNKGALVSLPNDIPLAQRTLFLEARYQF